MRATNWHSADLLADRWLSREGTDLPSPSAATRRLLADRLAARRRASLATASMAAIGTALLVPALFSADPQWRQECYRRYLLLGIMIATGLMLTAALHLIATSGRPWRPAPVRTAAVPSGDRP